MQLAVKWLNGRCLRSEVFVHRGDEYVFLRPTLFSETFRLSNKTREMFNVDGEVSACGGRLVQVTSIADHGQAVALKAHLSIISNACPSDEQQLHRSVHKHRGRIKGGGTS